MQTLAVQKLNGHLLEMWEHFGNYFINFFRQNDKWQHLQQIIDANLDEHQFKSRSNLACTVHFAGCDTGAIHGSVSINYRMTSCIAVTTNGIKHYFSSSKVSKWKKLKTSRQYSSERCTLLPPIKRLDGSPCTKNLRLNLWNLYLQNTPKFLLFFIGFIRYKHPTTIELLRGLGKDEACISGVSGVYTCLLQRCSVGTMESQKNGFRK